MGEDRFVQYLDKRGRTIVARWNGTQFVGTASTGTLMESFALDTPADLTDGVYPTHDWEAMTKLRALQSPLRTGWLDT